MHRRVDTPAASVPTLVRPTMPRIALWQGISTPHPQAPSSSPAHCTDTENHSLFTQMAIFAPMPAPLEDVTPMLEQLERTINALASESRKVSPEFLERLMAGTLHPLKTVLKQLQSHVSTTTGRCTSIICIV